MRAGGVQLASLAVKPERPQATMFAVSTPYSTRSFGDFTLFVTSHDVALAAGAGQDIVLVKGAVSSRLGVLCRITSRCITSTALDAYDCDCIDQIRLALSLIHEEGSGILIYLDQEGRGHGLLDKVRAMQMKEQGYDTFSAFEKMGMVADVTDYTMVPTILSTLGVGSIRLISNNPHKRRSVELCGVDIDDVVPCAPQDVPHGALRHLKAKKQRGHSIDIPGDLDAV